MLFPEKPARAFTKISTTVHLNYHFLRHISAALHQKLNGFAVAACFSQHKGELVLGFTNGQEDFYLKAILTPQFSALDFTTEFHRKKQNSVDLFKALAGQTVEAVVQHKNERSFYIAFSNNYTLLFKLFGNRSNLVLYHAAEAIAIFNHQFPADRQLNPWQMDREFSVSPADFPLTLKALQQKIPTLGDLPALFLAQHNFETMPAAEQEKTVALLLKNLNRADFYLVHVNHRLQLSLLPVGKVQEHYTDALEAAHRFATKFQAENYFLQTTGKLRQKLEKEIYATEQTVFQVENKLKMLATDASFSQTADVIMANLTNIPAGATEAELYDFYQDKNRLIKLKKGETPQKTAEKLYKKAKSQQIEIKLLQEKAQRKTASLFALEEQLEKLKALTDNRQLREYLKRYGKPASENQPTGETLFKEFETEGFKILVGKNARNNDVLTQKHAHKEDLWLHAKDVSGSHVVVKYKAGKAFPKTVIEKAAQLAAYYSKRKNDSLCPVSYTPKKFVRKPKGAAPGAVLLEREDVLLVVPHNPFDQNRLA